MAQPVLWADSVQRMIEEGVTVFLEFGAGQVLPGWCSAWKATWAMAVGDASTAQAAVPWLAERARPGKDAATGVQHPARRAPRTRTGPGRLWRKGADVAQERPHDRPLDGKVALVTGASGAIGAIARHLAPAGARNLPLPQPGGRGPGHPGRHPRAGGEGLLVPGDVTSGADVTAMVQQTAEAGGGRIDILVNTAGTLRDSSGAPGGGRLGHRPGHQPAQRLPRLPRRAAPHDAPALGAHRQHLLGGRPHGNVGQSNYSAAKAGLFGLTRALARKSPPAGSRSTPWPPGLSTTA